VPEGANPVKWGSPDHRVQDVRLPSIPIGSVPYKSMNGAPVEISHAGRSRLASLSSIFARAFVDDPMMRWSLLGERDPEELLNLCFTYFLEIALDLGLVWEAGDANGAAVWIPPGSSDHWVEHPWSQPRILELSDDGGGRYDAFWTWVESHIPDEPLWHLDSIAVDPLVQGKGYGRSLIEVGQSMAAATGFGAILSTGTERNVLIYKRYDFHIVDYVDAPNGGPHIWFMRWEPK
jgi:GNAT superfamily N-acetyltransferase